MNVEQALKHNAKLQDKIEEIKRQMISRYRVRVVERSEEGRRLTVEDVTTDFIENRKLDDIVKEYRSLYNDHKKFFVLVDEVENIKRRIDVVLPTRTKDDREPPAGISNPPEGT